jgi:hypothetical protein
MDYTPTLLWIFKMVDSKDDHYERKNIDGYVRNDMFFHNRWFLFAISYQTYAGYKILNMHRSISSEFSL